MQLNNRQSRTLPQTPAADKSDIGVCGVRPAHPQYPMSCVCHVHCTRHTHTHTHQLTRMSRVKLVMSWHNVFSVGRRLACIIPSSKRGTHTCKVRGADNLERPVECERIHGHTHTHTDRSHFHTRGVGGDDACSRLDRQADNCWHRQMTPT